MKKLLKNRKVTNKIKRAFHWFTKTRRRKILSSTLAILITITSIRFILFPVKEVEASIYEVTSSSTDTLDQTRYTPIESMPSSPGNGHYLVIFSMNMQFNSTAADNTFEYPAGATFPGLYAAIASAHFHEYG